MDCATCFKIFGFALYFISFFSFLLISMLWSDVKRLKGSLESKDEDLRELRRKILDIQYKN